MNIFKRTISCASTLLIAAAATMTGASFNCRLATPSPVTAKKTQAQNRDINSNVFRATSPTVLTQTSRSRANATGADALEGTWTFTFGDYYFEDSSNGYIAGVFEATFENGLLFFQSPSNTFYPFVAIFDEQSSKLSLPTVYLGTASIYHVFQIPFAYNWETEDLDLLQQLDGVFDPYVGTVTFPTDCGIIWGAFYDENATNFYSYLDILDVVKGQMQTPPMTDSWNDIGDATFVDGWVLPAFGINQNAEENHYKVPLQQNVNNPDVYRLVDPYHLGPAADYNESRSAGYIVFDVSDPDNVIFKQSNAGFANSQLGITELYCYNFLGFLSNWFPNYTTQQLREIFGADIPYTTFKDGVVNLAPISDTNGDTVFDANFGHQEDSDGGYAHTNADMTAKIIFPLSGLADIREDIADSKTVYYNLQGVEIANPQKGELLIKKTGTKSQKIIF